MSFNFRAFRDYYINISSTNVSGSGKKVNSDRGYDSTSVRSSIFNITSVVRCSLIISSGWVEKIRVESGETSDRIAKTRNM